MRLSCRRLEIGGLCFAGRGVHCRHDCLLWIKALPAHCHQGERLAAWHDDQPEEGGEAEAAALLLSLARVSEIDDGFRGFLDNVFFFFSRLRGYNHGTARGRGDKARVVESVHPARTCRGVVVLA